MVKCKVNPGCSVVRAGEDGGRYVLEAGEVFETDSDDAKALAESGVVSLAVAAPPAPAKDKDKK